MDILVTLDENYLERLKVLLTSMYLNHPGEKMNIYLLHRSIPEEKLAGLKRGMEKLSYELIAIQVPEDFFAGAPTTDRYPSEIYYRLLADRWLPQDMDRILYLDPDILIINPLYELWNLNIDDYLFAAASHISKKEVTDIVNRVRLGTNTDYFNTGVMLFNLKQCRKEIKEEDIYRFLEKHAGELLLPDQDVLNSLYGHRVLQIDDAIWNYDARNSSSYMLRSGGVQNKNWVLKHTSVLHFCGRGKPWKKSYRKKVGILYRHYMRLTERYFDEWQPLEVSCAE